jgi:hypothetical protein
MLFTGTSCSLPDRSPIIPVNSLWGEKEQDKKTMLFLQSIQEGVFQPV